jgi:hypothetical protein
MLLVPTRLVKLSRHSDTISASSHHLSMVISSMYGNTNYISQIDRMEWITYYNFFLACLGGFKQYMQGVTHPPLHTYLD